MFLKGVAFLNKYTINDIKQFVSDIGLGGCVEGDIIFEGIQDEELKELWAQARESLNKIRQKLNT